VNHNISQKIEAAYYRSQLLSSFKMLPLFKMIYYQSIRYEFALQFNDETWTRT
jgi:hypothetical protein